MMLYGTERNIEIMGIAVFGAVMVDIKGYPQSTFIPAGRNVGRVEQVHGGVGRNIAEDIANVELRPTFVSLLDHSGVSVDVLEKLNRHKVNTQYIHLTDDGLGTWLAVFNNDGDVYASISVRPNLRPIMDILTTHGDEIIRNADSVVIEFDMDRDIVKRIFQLARKYEKRVYAAVSNISIALERRDLLQFMDCFICNLQESEILFSENYHTKSCEEMAQILSQKVYHANIPRMVVTMGDRGAVYAERGGECGCVPPQFVEVRDTTGAGDAFFSGVTIGLTYGKTLRESCAIGTRLASSVIATSDSVCPRFLPSEFGLNVAFAQTQE